ncbi:hypothetical protein FEM48_Zijuj01G0056900 [Ziziphus jujuba var. spinosa]|uniref:Fe2OG dioxygenase domain-containing protein n=1 Tax=Ziziphus jujuba var. spinosa TaxID=714518 RepID=A0A978VZG1_ZIZJJ|nr:hypothetical protein FEM48_Zijuj01G0056900 [Ziziphus jujuba var. spinosa]
MDQEMEARVEVKLEGSTLRVPSVQELAKQAPKTVPPRYIRPDQDPPIISAHSTTTSLPEVPIIDMNKLLYSDEFMEAELDRLHCACKEWVEEKNKFEQRDGEIEGLGQVFVVSEEQKLDWADMFYILTLPTRMRKPHLFPNLPLHFRDTLEAYSVELENIAHKILELMAKALRMDPKDMRELFEEGWQSMRMNYYPPCPQPDLVIGLNPHSDAAALTILLQVNEKEGLQIRKDGNWVPIKPLPGAFIINIGDVLEIVTNGIYPSIEHRAIVNSEEERMSIATFYSPKLDGELGPAPSLVSKETPALFKRIGVADYYKGFFTRKLIGKSYVDAMRIHDHDVIPYTRHTSI